MIGLQSEYTWLVRLDGFMSCLTISSASTLSLGVVVGTSVVDGVGDGVADVVVVRFGAGV